MAFSGFAAPGTISSAPLPDSCLTISVTISSISSARPMASLATPPPMSLLANWWKSMVSLAPLVRWPLARDHAREACPDCEPSVIRAVAKFALMAVLAVTSPSSISLVMVDFRVK